MSASPDIPTAAGVVPALVRALGKLDDIHRSKTAEAGRYAYSYADLADVLGHARPILAAEGLAVTQHVSYDNMTVTVRTVALHTSGESYEFDALSMPAGAGGAQQIGSAMTYARRYALMAALGLAADDDDGAAAQSATTAADRNRQRRPPPQPEPRTEAEAEIRRTIAELEPELRSQFVDAFRSEFGCILSELDADRHDEGLGFLRRWAEPARDDDETGVHVLDPRGGAQP